MNGQVTRSRSQACGHRTYGDADLRRLTFIRRCRDFGFPVEQVRTLITMTEDPQRECFEARDLAQAHVDAARKGWASCRPWSVA